MPAPYIPPQGNNERTMALISYLATWITGLVILLTSDKNLKYQRWHAIQAIGFGIALVVVIVVLQILVFIFAFGGSVGTALVTTILFLVVWIGFLVVWILLMVNAYQGKLIRLPIIADIADKNA